MKCTQRGSFQICVNPGRGYFTGQLNGSFMLTATDKTGRPVGELQLESSTSRGNTIARVASIDVIPSAQRSGVGTALYEEALAVSCAQGLRLISDFARSPYAEAFWRKQKKKQRAVCIQPNPKGSFSKNYFGGNIEKRAAEFEHECYELHRDFARADACIRSRLRGLLKGLPRPSRSDGGFYWPCGSYGIRKEICKGSGSLKGLRR